MHLTGSLKGKPIKHLVGITLVSICCSKWRVLMASDKAVETKEVTSPYSVLGVSENSSYEEIKRAYQKLLLKV